jgi:hypothetical protein
LYDSFIRNSPPASRRRTLTPFSPHWWKLSAALFALAIACQLSACVRVYVAADKSQTGNSEADDSVLSQTLTAGGSGAQPPSPCFLKSQVPSAQQRTGSWCWAASTQLIVEYLTKIPTQQCDLVSEVFHGDLKARVSSTRPFLNCCPNPAENPNADIPAAVADICDVGGWPEWALDKRGIGYVKKDTVQGLLNWTSLTHEICEDRPFIFVVKWSGGGRHSAVGGGYHTTAQFGNFVEVYDHSPDGFYVMPYKEFSGNQGSFTHEFDYVDIQVQ